MRRTGPNASYEMTADPSPEDLSSSEPMKRAAWDLRLEKNESQRCTTHKKTAKDVGVCHLRLECAPDTGTWVGPGGELDRPYAYVGEVAIPTLVTGGPATPELPRQLRLAIRQRRCPVLYSTVGQRISR